MFWFGFAPSFTLALLGGTAGIEAQGREKQQLGVPRVGKVQMRDRAWASGSNKVHGGLGGTKQGFISGKKCWVGVGGE